MKDAIELLSESEDDCQIYANESRLKDFTRGVELARQDLLRWRSPHSEEPPHSRNVLVKLQIPSQIYIGRYDCRVKCFVVNNLFVTLGNVLGWRPIEEE